MCTWSCCGGSEPDSLSSIQILASVASSDMATCSEPNVGVVIDCASVMRAGLNINDLSIRMFADTTAETVLSTITDGRVEEAIVYIQVHMQQEFCSNAPSKPVVSKGIRFIMENLAG